MTKFVITAAALLCSVPALAQGTTTTTTGDGFYIVQDTSTKRCTIVDKKPTSTTTVVMGDGTMYKTRTEAETGMKSVKVCTM